MKDLIGTDKPTVDRLAERLKRASTHAEYQRIQCVLIRATLGSTAAQIAQVLGWSTATVHVIHSRWAKEGDAIFELRGRGGRHHQYLSIEQEQALLRTCLRSSEQKGQEGQVDELQAGVEQPLAVLGKSPVLVKPCKAAFDNPALGHDLESVQLTAPGDLHRDILSQNFAHPLRERLAHIACICQQRLHTRQRGLATRERLQRPLAIRHLCRGYRHRVRQTLRIHRNVPLDSADLLASVINLERCRIRVLHALRVHDQERAARVAPQSLSGRANLIFLKPTPAR